MAHGEPMPYTIKPDGTVTVDNIDELRAYFAMKQGLRLPSSR